MFGKDEYFKKLFSDVFQVGVGAAKPDLKFRALWQSKILSWLDEVAPDRQCVWVYGAGKAAASMAAALEDACGQTEVLRGFVLTRKGQAIPTRSIEVLQAAHPVPDEDGQRAAKRLLNELEQVPKTDPVIALISGGGSSLLSVPVKEIPFVDLQQLNRALLLCGAPIQEINVVRKHVTQTLGGQLAKVCTAPVFQVLISDVPGDDPSFIASGPFSPDDSTFKDAADVLKRWGVQVPLSVARYIERGCRGEVQDTPSTNSRVFDRIDEYLLASNAMSLDAVTHFLQQAGFQVLDLGDALEGEAKDVARVVASMVRQVVLAKGGWPTPPLAILSGGECTVTMSELEMKQAKGGRNTEFLLALICCLQTVSAVLPIAAMAADTDGVDGFGGHAGAMLLPSDLALIRHQGLAPGFHLDQHTSFNFFKQLDRLMVTGPTNTNVNDIRVVCIGQPIMS